MIYLNPPCACCGYIADYKFESWNLNLCSGCISSIMDTLAELGVVMSKKNPLLRELAATRKPFSYTLLTEDCRRVRYNLTE